MAEAASELYEQKQKDLYKDAGENAEDLRARLSELVLYCSEVLGKNVFLVEVPKLQEEDWGNQIQALVDLRFLHRIATLSTKRGGEAYAGRKFAAFTLDISTWTSTRTDRDIKEIPFWETNARQQIRSTLLIYTPELARERTAALKSSSVEEVKAPVAVPAGGAGTEEKSQMLLFEFDESD